MFRHRLLMLLLLASPALPLQAADAAPGRGLKEIPDPELNLMRGRYTVGGNTVAWFGVTMVSQWQAGNGNVLQGALTLGMDRGGGSPKLSFQPSVHVTAADSPLPDTQGRHIDSTGLANANGLVQSVQVAGDGNVARNATTLVVRNGTVPGLSDDGAHSLSAQGAGVSASAVLDGNQARLQLQVEGQAWSSNGYVTAASARASPWPVTARSPATSCGWNWCGIPRAATCR